MPFELQPQLRGTLLALRPLRPEDFGSLFAVAADPLIWEQHPSNDRYQEAIFRDFFRDALQSGGALLVTDAATGAVIGSSRFNAYDGLNSEIEIGWTFLARSYWGGGYNRELKRLMVSHALQFVQKVIFVVGVHNWRSQRAVEKLGGVRTGSRIDAQGRVSVVFTLTAATSSL